MLLSGLASPAPGPDAAFRGRAGEEEKAEPPVEREACDVCYVALLLFRDGERFGFNID